MDVLGTTLTAKGARPCGLCGTVRKPSRTHVPPQVAGNTGRVQRAADVLDETRTRRPGRYSDGGLWVRGLCEDCNNLAGRKYDRAYADFADRISTVAALQSQQFYLPDRDVPAANLAPNQVARSALFGMFAVHPRLRVIFPSLADDLHREEPSPRWPNNLQLKVTGTEGNTALLSSGVFMARVLGPQAGINHFTFSEIVFPPLAWALTPADVGPQASDRWADASEWVRYSPERTQVDLRNLTTVFGRWQHPRLNPGTHDDWIELHGQRGTDAEAVILLGRIP